MLLAERVAERPSGMIPRSLWALDLPCELQDPIAFRDQYRTTRQAALGALANVKEKDGLVDEVPTEEINRRLMESIVSAQANIVVARRECAYLRQHRNAGHRHHRDGSSSAERRTQNIERTVLQGEQQSSDLKDLTGSPQSIPSKTCVHLDDAVQIREFNAFEPSEKLSPVHLCPLSPANSESESSPSTRTARLARKTRLKFFY